MRRNNMWVYRDVNKRKDGILKTRYEIGYFDQGTNEFVVTRETMTRSEAEKLVSRLNGGSDSDGAKLVLGIAAVTLGASYVFLKRAQKIQRKKQRRLSLFR